MKFTQILVGIVIVAILVAGYLFSKVQTNSNNQIQNQPTNLEVGETATGDCIPTFADGGGPYYKLNSPFREKIVPEQNNGEKLVVEGKVLRNDCKTPVANAVLDIWQANETGDYQDAWYRGKVTSKEDGSYKFETIVPKGYGEGTGYRPPHIHFKVFENNREIIISQMFFPEVKGTPGFNDAYIMKLETREENGKRVHFGNHNIILP